MSHLSSTHCIDPRDAASSRAPTEAASGYTIITTPESFDAYANHAASVQSTAGSEERALSQSIVEVIAVENVIGELVRRPETRRMLPEADGETVIISLEMDPHYEDEPATCFIFRPYSDDEMTRDRAVLGRDTEGRGLMPFSVLEDAVEEVAGILRSARCGARHTIPSTVRVEDGRGIGFEILVEAGRQKDDLDLLDFTVTKKSFTQHGQAGATQAEGSSANISHRADTDQGLKHMVLAGEEIRSHCVAQLLAKIEGWQEPLRTGWVSIAATRNGAAQVKIAVQTQMCVSWDSTVDHLDKDGFMLDDDTVVLFNQLIPTLARHHRFLEQTSPGGLNNTAEWPTLCTWLQAKVPGARISDIAIAATQLTMMLVQS